MSEFISLYSGSSGNSSVVRCGERYLIVDMGKGVRTTGAALKELELSVLINVIESVKYGVPYRAELADLVGQ